MTMRSGADRHGLFSYDLRVWSSYLLDVCLTCWMCFPTLVPGHPTCWMCFPPCKFGYPACWMCIPTDGSGRLTYWMSVSICWMCLDLRVRSSYMLDVWLGGTGQ